MKTVIQSIILLIVLIPMPGFACRCLEPSAETAFNRAAVVVQARTEDVIGAPEGDGLSVVLKVSRSWKKATTEKIIVNSLTSCYYPFEKNKSYILFLSIEPDGLYSTGRCYGNRELTEATDLREWLENRE